MKYYSIFKSRDITLPTKVRLVKAMVFPVVMYGCESWTLNKAECQRIDAFELWCWRRLENPLNTKEITPVNLKGNKPWILTGRTNAEAEAPIFWPPEAKSWFIRKDHGAEKDWRQKKMVTKDEIFGWHHRCNGHEVGQTLGDGEGQGSLACCSPWRLKESDMTWRLNNKQNY